MWYNKYILIKDGELLTDGTSQGLFIVVAIVIFGIFVSLSYNVFGSMGDGLSGIFTSSIESAESRLSDAQNNLVLDPNATAQEYFRYTISGRSATITKYIGSDADVVIPNLIVEDGVKYPVTVLAEFSFYKGTNVDLEPIGVELSSVEIPDTVKTIGAHAFRENALESVYFPDSVENIGERAFRGNNLVTIRLSNSLTEIDDWVFTHNQLESLTLPSGITAIGEHAFRDNNLTEVSLPDTLTHISDDVFRANNLEQIYIPNSVDTIGQYAFVHNQLTVVELPSHTTYRDQTATWPTFDSNVTITTR